MDFELTAPEAAVEWECGGASGSRSLGWVVLARNQTLVQLKPLGGLHDLRSLQAIFHD